MAIRIASVVLSLAVLLALILGLLFWNHLALNLLSMHIWLGFLTVGALWVIGIGQIFSSGGSWLFAAAALILGVLIVVLGMAQTSLMIGDFHWIVQVVHLLLGLAAVGVGHMGSARYRRNITDQAKLKRGT